MPRTESKKSVRRGTKTCMVPGCTRPVHTRGICNSCYQIFRQAKRAGEITDAEAVAAGIIGPARGEPSSPMSAAIKSVKRA